MSYDPYKGNVLVAGLRPSLSPTEVLESLFCKPTPPRELAGIPKNIRLHMLMDVRDFHFPSNADRQLYQTLDLMVRQGYKYRDPRSASTWGVISGERKASGILIEQAMAACAEGIPGTGKTQGCLRCCRLISEQLIRHESFPRLEGGLNQVAWQSIEIPPSGKSADLARALMLHWKYTTGSTRFDRWLAMDRISDGMRALDEWRQVAVGHFLGVLHLDEIQNLFKLSTLRQRKASKGSTEAPELSIVEDQVLRWLLHLTNSGQIPVLLSGTPDGVGALTKRLSTLERIHTAGYHRFDPISLAAGEAPVEYSLLGNLAKYQYVCNPIAMDQNLAQLVIELTAGVPRIIIALWIASHRVAFERKSDDLRLSDFTTAASTWLAPLAPAVAALRSQKPNRLAQYEDLVPGDTAFWANFWSQFSP